MFFADPSLDCLVAALFPHSYVPHCYHIFVVSIIMAYFLFGSSNIYRHYNDALKIEVSVNFLLNEKGLT